MNDYKKAVSGLSSNIDSCSVLLALTNFIRTYHDLYLTKSLGVQKELSDAVNIITYIAENKSEIFKDKIRLFAPTKKTGQSSKFEPKELQEKITDYNKILEKVEKKLSKLMQLRLSYEYLDTEEIMETKKLMISLDKNLEFFLKDYNQLYANNIKYISEDKITNLHTTLNEFSEKYEKIYELSSSLEEIFAMQRIISNSEV